MPSVDLDILHRALRSVPALAAIRRADLVPLSGMGIAHDHVRLVGTGSIARIPRVSQLALAARDNLDYQAACFDRLAASGVTPRRRATIAPGDLRPMGALIVEEIVGRPARVPDDLPAIADTLAAIHALPLPPPEARPPLADHPDPVGGTAAVIAAQAAFFAECALDNAVRAALDVELAWAADFAQAAAGRDQPQALVGTDTHPGNFVVDHAGRAIFVDLEKALYGSPAIDVAHATLATSVMWSAPDAQPVPAAAIDAFERRWHDALPPMLAARITPWIRPMRRMTWLRSMTWFARWRVLSRRDEGWSAARLDPALAAHVESRTALFLGRPMVEAVRAEWRDG